MHYRHVLFICFLLVSMSFSACGQHKGFDVAKEIDRLKNFDREPIYQVRIHSSYTYTILVNGIPIANKLPYLNNYIAEINPCIPASGEQEIEIRIYPRFDDLETQKEFLEKDIEFELTIEKTAWKDGILEEPEVIYNYRLPEADYANEKSFVHSDGFMAEVPYRLVDWRAGTTFNQKDSVALKTKALKVYEELISHYENRRGTEFYNAIGKGLFNLYQASYFSKENASENLENNISFIDKEKRNLQEIENYRLAILGNGKLLALKRTDEFNREEGVLRRHYQKNRKETVHVYDVLLYAPESDRLEVVWFFNLVKPTTP